MLAATNLNIDALDFDAVVDDNYSVDLDDTHHRTDVQDAVVIPENSSLILIKLFIHPLAPSNYFGIDLYEETMRFPSLLHYRFIWFMKYLHS